MQPFFVSAVQMPRVAESVTTAMATVTAVFIPAIFLFRPMLFLSPLLLVALFFFTLLLLIALALFALFLPLLVRFEVPAAVAVMVTPVTAVLLIPIVADPLELVLAQPRGQLAALYMTPWAVIVGATEPAVIPVEIVGVINKDDVVRHPDGNIEPQCRRHDEFGRGRQDDPGRFG